MTPQHTQSRVSTGAVWEKVGQGRAGILYLGLSTPELPQMGALGPPTDPPELQIFDPPSTPPDTPIPSPHQSSQTFSKSLKHLSGLPPLWKGKWRIVHPY